MKKIKIAYIILVLSSLLIGVFFGMQFWDNVRLIY